MTNHEARSLFHKKLTSWENTTSGNLLLARKFPVFPWTQILCLWRLITIISGKRTYRFSNGEQVVEKELKAGDVLLIEPSAGISLEENSDYEMLSVVCYPNMVRMVFKSRTADRPVSALPDATLHCGEYQTAGIRLLMETMMALCTPEVRQSPTPLLKILIEQCLSAVTNSNQLNCPEPQYLFGRIIAYVNDHITKELSCGKVAAHFGISPNYVAQLFSRCLNCGFINYIRAQRLELSIELLKNSNLQISEIAMQCGFRQPYYFIRIFKRKFGVTPKSYRSQYFKAGNKS